MSWKTALGSRKWFSSWMPNKSSILLTLSKKMERSLGISFQGIVDREMHLWPSEKLRDSFKLDYLNNLEWNLRRLKSDKKKKNQSSGSSNQESLLCDDKTDNQNCCNKDRSCGCASAVLKDLLMILSCWCCCYCWGGIADARLIPPESLSSSLNFEEWTNTL
ncbi:hypothetical protein Ccrd_011891 [Cynara cardunculus var. scolymus]|uniref:Uncharacterized protein n=1 Tax=Cynara cardunculus var. scolymus TaxID=59895 RepID=A0A103YIK1_CYNCS|nr:hypothetical protein Ccrd_011891 [Cynara cardunculus var. scolymus]